MMSFRAISAAIVVGGVVAAGVGTAAAQALPLPRPRPLAAGLDLECYRTPGPALNQPVNLTHLNPVFVAAGLPAHMVVVRELQQTCVPVRKNNVNPDPTALPFIRHLDLACYRVDAPQLPTFNVFLSHLNPVLANQPSHNVTMLKPAQLCVPVAKNDVLPPPDVLAFARFFDLECWDVQGPAVPSFGVGLSQLNPQLTAIAAHPMTLVPQPRQLCVPVRKNAQAIPAAVLDRLRWLDLEKFAASPQVVIAPRPIVLNHLNPLFANFPDVNVVLEVAVGLMVPVAKNQQLPPD